jgi:hypothetical protein
MINENVRRDVIKLRNPLQILWATNDDKEK